MKKKIIQIGYVLVVIGLIAGGVYNICTSHPVLSQYYTKIFSKEVQKEVQTEDQKETQENQNKTEAKTSTSESFTQKETNTQMTFDNTGTNHIHTWESDTEWTWVGNKDGTGHVEKIIIEKCECGEYKTN